MHVTKVAQQFFGSMNFVFELAKFYISYKIGVFELVHTTHWLSFTCSIRGRVLHLH